MRSLFTGVSGLKVHQTKMDVIGNNIANVNTVAYKSSRATFNEFFSQTLSGATQGSATSGKGGTNPMQIGLGVSLGSIDNNMNPGIAQRTDRPFDLMVEGEGFFVISDASGTYFTRDGNFTMDDTGKIVNSSGMSVMGWGTKIDPDTKQYVIDRGIAQPLVIDGEKNYATPSTTTKVNFEGNLNSTKLPLKTTTMDVFDSVGNVYTLDVEMKWNGTAWDVKIGDDGKGNTVGYPNSDRSNPATLSIDPNTATLTFDENGLLVSADASGATSITMKITGTVADGLVQEAVFGDDAESVTVDFSSLTMFGNEDADATSRRADGNYPGSLSNLSIGADGSIVGQYTNGETRVLGMIPVAIFKNPAGLEKMGGNMFAATMNSGDFDGVGMEVGASGGSILGGVLEMSNVDLSSEFTEMITTQRGFQANSRTITTSDEMLQELINLKR